jgi:hydroxymethylglutaryl-CoA synthase
MPQPVASFGISGLKLYVPPFRVSLEDWCGWTDHSWDKIRAVVGHGFRVPGPHENLYTMAANAVLRLICDYHIDPQRVSFLGLGTESSTDNSAGAIIVKGMVDRALSERGLPVLSRQCEVPEFKHACLAGVYAQNAALRYLGTDGQGSQAIVVAADIAEYERGSTGEQTQGAGALAMLLEANPSLYAVDLAHAGRAAAYRGADFRKPFQRYPAQDPSRKLRDFPLFNGTYSTACYLDEVLRAMEDFFAKRQLDPRTYYQEVAGAFLHRPYHRMPIQALATLYVFGLARRHEHHAELASYATQAGTRLDGVLQEMSSAPDLCALTRGGAVLEEATPESMKVVRAFQKSRMFDTVVSQKLQRGQETMMHLGNLYAAALPAWIAAGLEDALHKHEDLAGKELLTVGYGSGDAAFAAPITPSPRWPAAAARMGVAAALSAPIDLSFEQYQALHDGTPAAGLSYTPRHEFLVDRVGKEQGAQFQDCGIEYYRYVR